MDHQLMLLLESVASVLGGLIVLAALVLLWWKSHSPWLLLAIAGEGVGLLFRLAYAVAASALTSVPVLMLIWPLMGLLVAAGLFGYAVEESNRRP